MQCIPQIIQFDAGLIIELNCFNSWKFLFFDSVYQLPEFTLLGCNLIDFLIKEFMFGLFYSVLKLFPVFDMLRIPIGLQIIVAIEIPPCFGALGDIENFGVLLSQIFNIVCNPLNNCFQIICIQKIRCVSVGTGVNELIDEQHFFFTAFD